MRISCVASGIPTRYSRVSQDEDLNISTNIKTGSLVDAIDSTPDMVSPLSGSEGPVPKISSP